MSTLNFTSFGDRFWTEGGELHRLDGPAIEEMGGRWTWCQHGKLHRDGAPALYTKDGYRAWYQHDMLHRLDGPAVEHPDGRCEWWVNGVRLPDHPTQEDILGALL